MPHVWLSDKTASIVIPPTHTIEFFRHMPDVASASNVRTRPGSLRKGGIADGSERIRSSITVRTSKNKSGRIPGRSAAAYRPPQGISGTVDTLLAGAPSMILRLIAR